MISVAEAIEIVKNNVLQGEREVVTLNESLDRYLFEDIHAPINVPSFNQSAMDGYAFKYEDVKQPLLIVDEVPAGDTRNITVNKGETVRIFTGAMVPETCDTVVMQELTEVNDHKLLVRDEGLKLGGNIRLEGHQIKQGALALTKGEKINPATIGFLASLGIHEVPVFKKPRITLLTTGDELIKPGQQIAKGQVYESNSQMLHAALREYGILPNIETLPDNLESTKEALKVALLSSDIILITGGISVGDYDFVKPALMENGVRELFYKVKQKPGKPLFFGKKDSTLIFALPGNPAAALNCFYIYVGIVIKNWLGYSTIDMQEYGALISTAYKKKSGRAEFLKANLKDGVVTILDGQGSDVLLSFSKANCLVFLSDEIDEVKPNQEVPIYNLTRS